MLPDLYVDPVSYGPVVLQPFGALMVTGFILGIMWVHTRTKAFGLDRDVMYWLYFFCIGAATVVAHMYDVTFNYQPSPVLRDPLVLFKIWEGGIGSFGSFIGAIVGSWLYLRLRKRSFLAYCDATIQGFALGWVFGRIGCTVSFDHPGTLTTFVLGMPYRGGEATAGIRHNLGFYEVFLAAGIFALFWTHRHKAHFAGYYLLTFAMIFMPVRFALDFLRVADRTYWGLTAGQFLAIAIFAYSAWKFRQLAETSTHILTPDHQPHQDPNRPAPDTPATSAEAAAQ